MAASTAATVGCAPCQCTEAYKADAHEHAIVAVQNRPYHKWALHAMQAMTAKKKQVKIPGPVKILPNLKSAVV